VLDLQYYLPAETQASIEGDLDLLPNGDYDIVEAIYDKSDLNPSSDGTKDPMKIAKVNFPDHKVTTMKNLTEEITAIVAEGMRDPLSLST